MEESDNKGVPPYRFNAKELDEETGLYYYGARYLDPTGVGWLSVDPLFEKYVGMSPYNYCAGNPVKLVDTDGRELEFKHYVPNNDDYYGGKWEPGMGEKIKDRWVDFASTKEGYDILAKFAKAGQSIGNIEFKENGVFSNHKLILYDYDRSSSKAGACKKPRVNQKTRTLTFYISIGTFLSEENVDVTIGHEFFLHFDTYYNDYINFCSNKNDIEKLNEKWKLNLQGDNDHKEYITDPKSFPKFRRYLNQLKEKKDDKKVEEAIKIHDNFYKKKFKLNTE